MPAGTPKVHAVVVHHRGQDLLARCLASLLASRGVDLQVGLVANACVEPLPDVAGDPHIHVLRTNAPIGFSAANNRGAALLRETLGPPEHLFFVNNDTVTAPDALRLLAEHLARDPRCAVVGPRLMIQGTDLLNSLGLQLTRAAEAWDEGIGLGLGEYGPLPRERPVLAVTGSALLIRSAVFESLGGWEEVFHFYYEDVDLCLRARTAGWEVTVVPSAVVQHALSATALRGSEFKLYHTWRNRLLLLVLHWPLPLLLAVAPRLVLTDLWRLLVSLARGRGIEARARVRAWLGFLRLAPRALAGRGRRGPRRDWIGFLHPAGSVPRIQLPAEPTPRAAAGAGARP